jgi:hypothetical protein
MFKLAPFKISIPAPVCCPDEFELFWTVSIHECDWDAHKNTVIHFKIAMPAMAGMKAALKRTLNITI